LKLILVNNKTSTKDFQAPREAPALKRLKNMKFLSGSRFKIWIH
jgi:hypothetical protein